MTTVRLDFTTDPGPLAIERAFARQADLRNRAVPLFTGPTTSPWVRRALDNDLPLRKDGTR